MSERAETAERVSAGALPRRGVAWSVEKHQLAIFAVATLAAWTHTVDEMRIGEFVAVPFGVANIAFLAAWPRVRQAWRAFGSLGFGLWWGLAAVPYHVVPLLQGSVTGQHISGVTRVVGGVAMVALGVAMLVRRSR